MTGLTKLHNAVRVFPPRQSRQGARGPRLAPRNQIDGYRMTLIRDQDRVRLISRGGSH
jgi:hypothetical protein